MTYTITKFRLLSLLKPNIYLKCLHLSDVSDKKTTMAPNKPTKIVK